MTKAFADYTYLAGNHGPRGSLWQGPDHLLVVDGTGWLISVAEVYRRIDYENIQSLTLVRTRSYFWMGWLWGIGAFLFGFFAVLAMSADRSQSFVVLMCAIPAVLLTIGLVVHLMRGPTCACALQTNVQLLRLRPLGRLRVAQPAMEKLAALCRQHQGVLTAEDAVAAAAAATPDAQVLPGTKPPWTGTPWTTAAGGLFVMWGLALIAEFFVPGVPFVLLDATLGAAALIAGMIALVRSARMRVPGFLLGAMLSALAVALFAILALVVPAIGIIAREDVRGEGRLDPQQSFSVERVLLTIGNFSYADAGNWAWGIMGLGTVITVLGLCILVGGRVTKAAAQSIPAPRKPPEMPPDGEA